ncbi:hypothetical protein M758_9G050300 [Ceratodon purpureus]|nr:hypothetical protein M758_9G050300 [Ceratodon purpureus]
MGRCGRAAPSRRSSLGAFVLLLLVMLSLAALTPTAQATKAKVKLVPKFYKSSCPGAEMIISTVVNTAFQREAGNAPAILRMFFHDCFIHGCDASVLIDGPGSEKNATENEGLHGWEIIDDAKAAVEKHCPGVVSCADILAMAAQLSVKKLSAGRIKYKLRLGRRDGLVSSAADVPASIPKETASVAELKSIFKANGLSTKDMVALSGAHSVGVAGCDKIQDRLTATPPDETLDATYAAVLKKQCPNATELRHRCHWEWECAEMANSELNLDLTTPNLLDEVYYKNLQANKGLLTSDQNLQTDPQTRRMVAANTKFRKFRQNFAKAMVRMGNNVHLTGSQGEIRVNCRSFN